MSPLRLFALLCLLALATAKRYDGAQVLRCLLTDELRGNFSSVIEGQHGLDVWGVLADGSADIMVETPAERDTTFAFFASSKCVVAVENVQALLDEFEAANAQAKQNASLAWFDEYQTPEAIYGWWKTLASNNAGITFLENISGNTRTAQNRVLYGVEINLSGTVKPWIYFQCQIHAREWISGMTCMWMIDNLLAKYNSGDAAAKAALNNFNWAIVPVVNPDGFAYTHQTTNGDRMWRKNCRDNTGCKDRPACCGVDINRNYNEHWGGGGSSTNPCTETYMGPSVASEPETQATSAYFNTLQQKASVYISIDWHSYSQLFLRPYGWTNAAPPNDAQLVAMGTGYVNAVKAVDGKTYTNQKSIQLYVTTGTASDYFFSDPVKNANGKTTTSRPASFTVELRPAQNPPGFLLPANQIIVTGQENYAGVMTLIDYVTKNGPLKN